MATELRSQADVLTLPAPAAGGDAVFYDRHPKNAVKGLALRVRHGGSRGFMFYYRFGGKQRRIKMGGIDVLTLEQARKAALKYRVALNNDEDPAAAKAGKRAAQALTFGKTVDDYIAARAPEMRERSVEATTYHLKIHWAPFHGLPLSGITRLHVATRLGEIKAERGPMSANRSRGTLSAMFAWAIAEGRCHENPVSGTRKNEEKVRERVLSDAELAQIWISANGGQYGRIVKLLMLTGQRRDEIGGLRWSEINKDSATISLPPARTKNDRHHDIPLSPMAMSIINEQPAILDRATVFGNGTDGWQGWSSSKAALDANCEVKGWTLHDLRRTCATGMGKLGVLPHVVEATLNHVIGTKVARTYNRADYANEKREALAMWAGHIATIVAQASGANVTKLRA